LPAPPENAEGCPVRVLANGPLLAAALREQRGFAAGWRIATLNGADDATLEPDAFVIVDLADAEAQRAAADTIRIGGFAGPILFVGGEAAVLSPMDSSVARPVRLGALLARIGAHGTTAQSAGMAALGPYQLVAAECALRDGETGRLVRLTELELKLLTYLIASQGQLVDREQLLQQVWGYSAAADTHTVETHIWRLRQKIETDDPATRFVVTETGGYRLALVGAAPSE
jgi:Transcriptional regulatory protein, C terminal